MAKKSDSSRLIVGLAILVAIVAVFYALSQEQVPPALIPPTEPGVTPTPLAPAVVTAPVNTGELELFLKSSTGSTGLTSNVLLLDKSYWKGNEKDTRYNIMRIHHEKGLDGLVGYTGGTPKAITVSSGEWSETSLFGKVGDELVIYTYKDTTPAAADNISTARLIKLTDFYRETGKWVWSVNGGPAEDIGKNAWNLYDHATYDWYDGTDTIKEGYFYGDSASADSNVIVTWYTRSTVQGQLAKDMAIYLEAPANYTSKFKSLTVTDKFGHSTEFTTMTKAENYGSADPISVASTILPSARTNFYWYYIGTIPADFVTLYTSGDKNRVTYELETDTYGSAATESVNVSFRAVQNSGALISSNGPFEIADEFLVAFWGGGSSGFS